MTSLLAPIVALLDKLAVSFDLPILEWIQANLQSPVMDKIMPIITLFGEGGIFWIAFAVVLMLFHKYRKVGIGMLVALILGVLVCNVTLKPLIARIRPYDYQMEHFGKEIILLIKAQHDYSFPSGHTIACFEASTVLLINDKRLGIPATILSLLVAFSRLYLYVHYPSDVIFSFFFGILFAIIGNAAVNAYFKKHPMRKGKYEA